MGVYLSRVFIPNLLFDVSCLGLAEPDYARLMLQLFGYCIGLMVFRVRV